MPKQCGALTARGTRCRIQIERPDDCPYHKPPPRLPGERDSKGELHPQALDDALMKIDAIADAASPRRGKVAVSFWPLVLVESDEEPEELLRKEVEHALYRASFPWPRNE